MFIQTSQVSNKRRDFPVCQASHHLNVHVCLLYKLHLYLCTWQDKTPEFGQKIQAPPPLPPSPRYPTWAPTIVRMNAQIGSLNTLFTLFHMVAPFACFFFLFFFWFPLLKVRSLLWSIISLSGSIPQALFFWRTYCQITTSLGREWLAVITHDMNSYFLVSSRTTSSELRQSVKVTQDMKF